MQTGVFVLFKKKKKSPPYFLTNHITSQLHRPVNPCGHAGTCRHTCSTHPPIYRQNSVPENGGQGVPRSSHSACLIMTLADSCSVTCVADHIASTHCPSTLLLGGSLCLWRSWACTSLSSPHAGSIHLEGAVPFRWLSR